MKIGFIGFGNMAQAMAGSEKIVLTSPSGTHLEYSAKRDIEYNGEAMPLTLYWEVNEFLSKGTYRVAVFADGHNIGNASFTFEK